jgi:hypothetical protein
MLNLIHQREGKLLIPKGWRVLAVGEIRHAGDLFCMENRWEMSSLADYAVTEYDPTIIREVVSEEENKKESKTKSSKNFNYLSLVPSGIFGRLSAPFHYETSAEKVAKYLKKLKLINESKKVK